MVHDILQQLPALGPPQRQCLATLFGTLLVRRGRGNCRTLRRSCDSAARTSARPVREPCAWPALPPRGLMPALDPRVARGAAPDASCLPQRGQPTCGRGSFFHGGARRAERGLERSTRAVVEGTRRCAFPRAGAPPPPGEEATQTAPEERRGAVSKPHRQAPRQRWPPSGLSPGVAGSEAPKQESAAGVSLARPARTTRRSAAACGLLDTGPPPTRRGARRQEDGQVHCQPWSRCADLGTLDDAPHRHLSTAGVWHKTLQRRWRLGVVRTRQAPATPRFLVLGSPGPARPGQKRVAL